jgi:hypothetical protein
LNAPDYPFDVCPQADICGVDHDAISKHTAQRVQLHLAPTNYQHAFILSNKAPGRGCANPAAGIRHND